MSRRRGRPSQSEGPVITREELVQIAARVIGRDGLARASMRGIAREAGVSLATVQHHFRTKDLLLKAVIDTLAPPKERPPAPPDIRAFFLSVVRQRLRGAVAHPGLTGQLLIDNSPEGRMLLSYLAESTDAMRQQDRQRLSVAIEAGWIRQVDADALITLMGVALPMLSSSKDAVRHLAGLDLDDDSERERLAAAISDILLYGLLPREEAP